MRLGEMKSHEKAAAEELERDPVFRREWERTARAREVAVAIIAYRAAHKLSQRALADKLGTAAHRGVLVPDMANPGLHRRLGPPRRGAGGMGVGC